MSALAATLGRAGSGEAAVRLAAALDANNAAEAPRVALLSRRRTDALLAGIERWPEGVYADPTTVEGRAAWYSFAFWQRLAAGPRLDIDALELQAGLRSLGGAERLRGQAFLRDQLENGARYCRELGQAVQFSALLDQVRASTPHSIAAMWTDTVRQPDQPVPHGAECDASCNRCLHDYANLASHGLLDWHSSRPPPTPCWTSKRPEKAR